MSAMLLIANSLLAALALIMFGLGLSLTRADFARVAKYPKAVVVALTVQMLLLPLASFTIAQAFDLPPALAIGLVILAAAPGGISANMLSHLFGGNVAMNITLTAVNTLLSIISIPIVVNLGIHVFAGDGSIVAVPPGKVVEVIVMVLIPVALGMAVAARFPSLAARADRPVRLFSTVVLVVVVLLSVYSQRESVMASLAQLGLPVLLFNVFGLAAGYGLSRWVRLDRPLATAIAFEVGIQNSTLAIYIAVALLGDFAFSLPTSVYSIVMYLTAPVFGMLCRRGNLSARMAQPDHLHNRGPLT
ncbi:MAG: bile acid:sodium symporter family protein [Rhodobacteraceae bacterium]|nr:bile acid:sodium symporter family protein [Paracoccaceae bacterium]MBR9823606.1 bile acid:sodium symporter family protein [Paracoccaceae bacterium]